MALPGKLSIGILEEDNPLKSYFRFKPLLVESEGSYTVFTEGQAYPDDGCTRIVPDKNESSHFKGRMRRIGLFCVVDLTLHAGENDKIRPNKNYHGDGSETNAFIIYSDVVREPAEGLIYEIIEKPAEGPVALPRTPRVLIREGGEIGAVSYGWEAVPAEGEEGETPMANLLSEGEAVDMARLQIFEIPGFREEILRFAVDPRAITPKAAQQQAQPVQQPEAQPVQPPAPQPPAAPEKPAEEKPWISRDASMLPRPVDPRLSPMQQMLAAQAGLNPRRGRSLQELIEDKWQYSRMNQLGHPVSPVATGAPVANPVEKAVEAVRAAWKNPDMRTPLIQSLSAIEEFGISLDECRKIVRESVLERELNNLEAQRLALLGEMDNLRRGRVDLREQLKQEIRREEAAAFADAVKKTQAARADQERHEKQAQAARNAVKSAQEALDALTNGHLEKKLSEFAANSRILEQLENIRAKSAAAENAAACVNYVSADLDALVDRVIGRFSLEGWNMDEKQAANLVACLLINPVMIFSGPAGSGKSAAARLLAEALGWAGAGRFEVFGPGQSTIAEDERLAALGEDPAMILLDDANAVSGDPFRGMPAAMIRPEWHICLGIQDAGSGEPAPANLLDRGFMIRLSRPDSEADWQPHTIHCVHSGEPVCLEAATAQLRAFAAEGMPEAIARPMAALRRALGNFGVTISRRALDDAWYYCAAMLNILGEKTSPAEVFDLAMAQRVLPALLATAPIDALARLPELIAGMPACQALLTQPLPIRI